MNSLKKGEGVPLLNFVAVPGVQLLNFTGFSRPTFKLWGGSRVPGSWSHFYAMPPEVCCKIGILIEKILKIHKRTPVLDSLSDKVAS